ncbi:ATP-dependent DNA ligase [Streptomyces aculeolatus]
MALSPPFEPMLAALRQELPPDGALPGGWAAELKIDGFRAVTFARNGQVVIQSRRGADLTSALPDLAAAAAALGQNLVLDGELVVPRHGRLDFGALQHRMRRRGRTAAQAAEHDPVYLIVFDVLEAAGSELLERPYRERRAVLEGLFAQETLTAPFTLCPATESRERALEWLAPAWGEVGVEGVVLKGRSQPYLPGKRGWIKVRARTTSQAVIAGVTGSLASPLTLLLGRYDDAGALRLTARTTTLAPVARRELARRLAPAADDHPWHGRRFSAGWGTRAALEYHPVQPELIAEFVGDTTVDDGRYRHAVRFSRLRDDLTPSQIPPFREPPLP